MTRLTIAEILRIGKMRDEKIAEMYPERCARRGMRQFVIDGVVVWALNEKNAMRKCGKPYNARKKSPPFANAFTKDPWWRRMTK